MTRTILFEIAVGLVAVFALILVGQGVSAGLAAQSTGELRAYRYATGLSQVEPVPVSIPFAGE